ncbi:MAG: helix-hairpin-helix domain-containing protein [Chitinophagaceae bacterium]|nr:helix-hairpin-helix domain-containing protein [Chitinophagaceae bacterium]
MKTLLFIGCFFGGISPLYAQEIPPVVEQRLELTVEADEIETEDDLFLQQLEYYKRNPININTVSLDVLINLRILSPLQIHHFLNYRKLFGDIISIYELQAIPLWDVNTINSILPYVTILDKEFKKEDFASRFRGGDQYLLGRVSQVLEKSQGYIKTSGSYYEGSRQHLMMRYRYRYKNSLQYGVVMDKDAGESFFSKSQKQGFDFYSAHLFATKLGKVEALAIGDYTVNLGQGLVQWQSLAFKKSADVMGIKRQSTILRPYNSAGEFFFNRGAGATLKFNNWQVTAFGSLRKMSANFQFDTLHNEEMVSSILMSGYHRTPSEIRGKKQLTQTSFGGNISLKKDHWHIGINSVNFHFDQSLQKRDEPYNLFTIKGNNWQNYSVDYSFTRNNIHFFGEAAMDKLMNKAYINGLLISLNTRADFSLLHRSISKGYQSLNGNAFTENTMPVNENGLYAGLSLRVSQIIKLDAYADLFSFPWLKYLADAPGRGKEFLVQFTYSPNKQLEMYSRIKSETKETNQRENVSVTNFMVPVSKINWRIQFSVKINTAFILRSRTELMWFNKGRQGEENGFLSYLDYLYKPMMKRFGGGIRLQYFETDSYNSRLYAYENDVLYNFSIPPFSGKGFRYYLNFNFDINKIFSIYFRFAQTQYKDVNTIGTGNDAIDGKARSEIKFQLIARW